MLIGWRPLGPAMGGVSTNQPPPSPPPGHFFTCHRRCCHTKGAMLHLFFAAVAAGLLIDIGQGETD